MASQRPRYGQKVNTTIQRLGVYGEGIGYWHGYTLFVEGALPGEVIQARVIERKRNYGRARPIHIDHFSPDRVTPICPVADRCGGCQVMHLSYASQLEQKRQRVIDALQRIGKIVDVPVAPCLPSPSPLHYRNKIQMPIRSACSSSSIQMGFYARNSHDLVPIEKCYIHCELGERIFTTASHLLKTSNLTAYSWETGEGILRYLVIKSAVKTGQALVILVTNACSEETLKPLAQSLMEALPEVKGVVQNINSSAENSVLGPVFTLLSGESHIEEEILGLRFQVSPASFFQVNPLQAENLYQKVLAFADLTGKETVLDAYCGVGTLSLLFARQAKRVIGVECISQAIEDAKKNAARNEIVNVHFICDEVENWIQQAKETMDVVLLNPPRKGCDQSLLEKIAAIRPCRIVYVSCDPATLARDLACLSSLGWRIEEVQPVDMFPQTAHVESVVKLNLLRN